MTKIAMNTLRTRLRETSPHDGKTFNREADDGGATSKFPPYEAVGIT